MMHPKTLYRIRAPDQMSPALAAVEIDRIRRFGYLGSYRAGEALVKIGEVGGMATRRFAGRSATSFSSLAPTRTRDWLAGSGVALDAKDFVRTGAEMGVRCRALETSRSGLLAIGDVRSGSVKRVAAAVPPRGDELDQQA